MQPRRMQSPPSCFAPSTTATFSPRPWATRAALKPALPPPMQMKSYAFGIGLLWVVVIRKGTDTVRVGIEVANQAAPQWEESATSDVRPITLCAPRSASLPKRHDVDRFQDDRGIQ